MNLSLIYFGKLPRNLSRDVLVSLLFAILIFSPFLFTGHPEFLFSNDLYNLYFPQFVQGYQLANAQTWYGIDILTNNGASAYYLRPNIPAYYPPHLLIFKFITLNGITELAKAFVWGLCIHAALSFFAILRLSQKYFDLDFKFSLFLATAYVFSIVKIIWLTPFYYVAIWFPILVYVALNALQRKTWPTYMIGSLAYVCLFLSGYLPLAIHAVILACVLAIVTRWIFANPVNTLNRRDFFYAILPAACASIIILPLYLAILQYHKLVLGLPKGVWVAHEMSYQITDLLALMSNGFRPLILGEAPHVIIGLFSLFMIVLAYTMRSRLQISDRITRLVIFSLGVFGFHIVLASGQATGLPDLFYYFVPGLGKMHLYGRYLIVSSFFLFLASTLLFKELTTAQSRYDVARCLKILVLIVGGIYLSSQFLPFKHVNVLLFELVFIGIFLILIQANHHSTCLVYAAIAMLALVKIGAFNQEYAQIELTKPSPYNNALIYSVERQQAFLNYVQQHAPGKRLIKYADLSSSIDKPNGVLLNFPWMVTQVPISNYMGYELHLSVDRDYLQKFPWFGKVDFAWLMDSGADYLLFDSAAKKTYSTELARYVDHTAPTLDLGYGHTLAKIKKPTLQSGTLIDNGIFSVTSADHALTVSPVEGNLSSYMTMNVRSTAAATVRYLMFPNKLMQFFIDGQPLSMHLGEKPTLTEFVLPPGEHRIEYRYKNRLHIFFVKLLKFYFLALFGAICWLIASFFYKRYFKRS